MKRILFYDITSINFRKYIPDIIDSISKMKSIEILLCYDEEDNDSLEYFKSRGISTYKTKLFENNKKIIDRFKPDLIVVNAQRISDTNIIAYAKKHGVKSIMIQHGMYIPFLKRESSFFRDKILKTIKYIYYIGSIAGVIKKRKSPVFIDFFNVFIKGVNYKNAIKYHDELNTDYVFVYGEYWKEYHSNNFGYRLDQQHVIGYHELNRLDAIISAEFEPDSICYIAQTLVEDGRMDEVEFKKFIPVLERLSIKHKVYVKLHPRSNINLYKNKNLILLENDIPNCRFYFGHYSSLLALFAHLEGELITWEFDNHPVPDYFTQISHRVFNELELLDVLKNSNRNEKNIDYYFSDVYSTKNVVDMILKFGLNN
jgi:hypothetical protein